MATFALPLLKDITADYIFQTELESVTYTFRVRWNDRDQNYFLDIMDSDANPLLNGLKLCLGKIFYDRFSIAGLPPGTIIAEDTTGLGIDPVRGDLGGRVRLIYFDSTEVL